VHYTFSLHRRLLEYDCILAKKILNKHDVVADQDLLKQLWAFVREQTTDAFDAYLGACVNHMPIALLEHESPAIIVRSHPVILSNTIVLHTIGQKNLDPRCQS
jgi:hypothetical protein